MIGLRRGLALAGALRRGTAADGLPYKLTLIVTRRCPTRCSFCSIWKTPSPDEMTLQEWDKVLFSASRAVWVNLSGGEVFQRPDIGDLTEILARRLRHLYLVDFPTTGYFPERTLDACERLVRGGVRKVLVTVSLDGPPDVHDRLRGRDGAFERAVEAMRALRAAKLPRVSAYFGMTLFPDNHGVADETVAAARAAVPGLTERDFHFNIGMESGHYYKNLGIDATPPLAALKVLERYRRRGLDPVSRLERAYQNRVPRYLDTGRSPVPCAALRASVFVDPQGVVYPCSIFDRPLGSLREHGYDLRQVLGGAGARQARKDVVAERCPGCWTPCEAYQSLFAHWTRSSPERPPVPSGSPDRPAEVPAATETRTSTARAGTRTATRAPAEEARREQSR